MRFKYTGKNTPSVDQRDLRLFSDAEPQDENRHPRDRGNAAQRLPAWDRECGATAPSSPSARRRRLAAIAPRANPDPTRSNERHRCSVSSPLRASLRSSASTESGVGEKIRRYEMQTPDHFPCSEQQQGQRDRQDPATAPATRRRKHHAGFSSSGRGVSYSRIARAKRWNESIGPFAERAEKEKPAPYGAGFISAWAVCPTWQPLYVNDMTKLGRHSDTDGQHGHEQNCVIAVILTQSFEGCPPGTPIG